MSAASYFLVFLEGIAAFISPCILPTLPIYLVYLGGKAGETEEQEKSRVVVNTLGFILGFTIIFTLMGATASALSSVINSNKVLLSRISGGIMIVFGLHYMGVFNIKILNREKRAQFNRPKALKFGASLLFGMAFSFGWTPCIGPLLGSALLLAANTDTAFQGVFMLFCFSMGLGLPYLATAVVFDKLTKVFNFIKKHYNAVKIISGILLIVVGLALIFNLFGYWQRFTNDILS